MEWSLIYVLSSHWPGRKEKSDKLLRSQYHLSEARFEPDASRVRSRIDTHFIATLDNTFVKNSLTVVKYILIFAVISCLLN
jgi:hypothetical protein